MMWNKGHPLPLALHYLLYGMIFSFPWVSILARDYITTIPYKQI